MNSLQRLLTSCFSFVLIVLSTGCTEPPLAEADESWREVAAKYACDPDNGAIELADGFCALVFADTVGVARHLAVRDNGDVYVAIRNSQAGQGGILALRDNTGDGRADEQEMFGFDGGTGIEIRGEYLYFGADTAIVRYRLAPGELVPSSEPEMMISGFPVQRSHNVKPFTFDESGNLYVNIGAPSNTCMEESRTKGSPGMDPCPELDRQAGIWRFSADTPGQTQEADGMRYSTGIRNAVGIYWNPFQNTLFATQHGRDQLHAFFPDLYTQEQSAELPAEELLRVTENSNFGWPYCYYDQMKGMRVRSPEYGGDGQSTEGCDTYDTPDAAFPGHWAPNDLLFVGGTQFPVSYREGVLIAFHGSWNRNVGGQQGFNIVHVPYSGNEVSGEWTIFADGFSGTDEEMLSNGVAVHRPTGLAQGPEGTVFIADDKAGRIWRIIYHGDEEQLASN